MYPISMVTRLPGFRKDSICVQGRGSWARVRDTPCEIRVIPTHPRKFGGDRPPPPCLDLVEGGAGINMM